MQSPIDGPLLYVSDYIHSVTHPLRYVHPVVRLLGLFDPRFFLGFALFRPFFRGSALGRQRLALLTVPCLLSGCLQQLH